MSQIRYSASSSVSVKSMGPAGSCCPLAAGAVVGVGAARRGVAGTVNFGRCVICLLL